MPTPKNKTKRVQIKPLGVSERLGDAPPTHYRYTDRRPDPDAVYTTDGTEHRFDGTCHPDCPNVR